MEDGATLDASAREIMRKVSDTLYAVTNLCNVRDHGARGVLRVLLSPTDTDRLTARQNHSLQAMVGSLCESHKALERVVTELRKCVVAAHEGMMMATPASSAVEGTDTVWLCGVTDYLEGLYQRWSAVDAWLLRVVVSCRFHTGEEARGVLAECLQL